MLGAHTSTPSCSGKRKASVDSETSPSATQNKDKLAKSELPSHLFGPPQQSTPRRDIALEPSFGSFVGAGISKILLEEEIIETEEGAEVADTGMDTIMQNSLHLLQVS